MEKTIKELRQEYNDLQEKSYTIRGKIIGNVIQFERMIDDYIATYFFPDGMSDLKFRELQLYILCSDKMTMAGKREVLLHLLNTHFNDWQEKYPKFKRYSMDIIETRNVVAHHNILVMTLGDDPTGVTFMKEKNKISFSTLTDTAVNEIVEKIEYCKEMLMIYTFTHFDTGKPKPGIIMVDPENG
jgi:hypothetical protein